MLLIILKLILYLTNIVNLSKKKSLQLRYFYSCFYCKWRERRAIVKKQSGKERTRVHWDPVHRT